MPSTSFLAAPTSLHCPVAFTVGMHVGAGAIARLTTTWMKKKLVRVVAVNEAWDTRSVAATLQHESFFAKDAYYVNAMFALIVRLGNTSSACERWGHELKLLWDPESTQTTSGLIHRLHGRLAGLRGNGTDEAFLDVVAASMLRLDQAADKRCAPRSGNSHALAVGEALQFRLRDQAGARGLYSRENLLEPHPVLGQKLAYSQVVNSHAAAASKRFETIELEEPDKDLLKRIRARDPGWRPHSRLAGRASQDLGSAMPWIANTRAQWEADLAKPK